VRVGLDNNWTTIAAGNYHSAGLKSDGSLWAWGANYSGESEDGTTTNRRPGRLGADNDWACPEFGTPQRYGADQTGSL
jgi:alpha-tubulin suppressor-like RCC1 family protein